MFDDLGTPGQGSPQILVPIPECNLKFAKHLYYYLTCRGQLIQSLYPQIEEKEVISRGGVSNVVEDTL